MNFKTLLKQRLGRFKWALMDYVSKRPRLAAFYYAIVDDGLSREAAGVLAGRVRYKLDHQQDGPSFFLLRRNIHRLEKGLIMRPRRPVFAANYLRETINIYTRSLQSAGMDWNSEHLWARDVLREYFSAVDKSHPDIAPQWQRFNELGEGPMEDSLARVPYARKLDQTAVAFDQMRELSMRRRSVRWYLGKPVPREMVDRALEVANQAPSACNRQPFVYRIFDDPKVAQHLAAMPMGTKGFAEKLQAVVVLVGRLRAYPQARDRHAIYIDGALSAMSFMFALETLGLSSCPINWPDLELQDSLMAEAIGLDPDERVIMLIAYGWPDPEGQVPYSAKKDHAQIRQYN
jgi:nitroreductase